MVCYSLRKVIRINKSIFREKEHSTPPLIINLVILYSSCTHIINSCTAQLIYFQAASASLNSDRDDFSTDNLQKSSEFLNIWKDNQHHRQYCSLMTTSHLLHFSTFLQLMFNQFLIFFMFCFTAFTQITPIFTALFLPFSGLWIYFSMMEQLVVLYMFPDF